VYVPSGNFEDIIDKSKIKGTLKTFETACKKFDINTPIWNCAVRVMAMFPPPIVFFEDDNFESLPVSDKFEECKRMMGNGLSSAHIVSSRTKAEPIGELWSYKTTSENVEFPRYQSI
jgi:hypothetical protein